MSVLFQAPQTLSNNTPKGAIGDTAETRYHHLLKLCTTMQRTLGILATDYLARRRKQLKQKRKLVGRSAEQRPLAVGLMVGGQSRLGRKQKRRQESLRRLLERKRELGRWLLSDKEVLVGVYTQF